ncbi:signal peptidase II [Guggenheimella bovis]
MLEIIIILFIIAMDQFTKYLVVTNFQVSETVPVIENVLHWTYAKNTGAAFSIFSKHTGILAGVSVVMSLVLIVLLVKILKKTKTNLLTIGLAFVIGGAIGNGIDRILLGYVVDFIDVRLIHFAIFNVADSFVTVGTILLIIDLLFFDKKREKPIIY